MNTYINREINGAYTELPFLLDENYNQGTTWNDYETGVPAPWVLLTPDQVAFRTAHPDSSIQEIFEMKQADPVVPDLPEPDSELEQARRAKLAEIKVQDEFSNKFFVSVTTGGVEIANQELWIDKDLRNSLYSITLPALQSDGETTTKLWTIGIPPQSIDVPISWALKYLPYLEIYAKRTYDLRASNEAATYTATTVEEIVQIDVKANYPHFLTFELNLDL